MSIKPCVIYITNWRPIWLPAI